MPTLVVVSAIRQMVIGDDPVDNPHLQRFLRPEKVCFFLTGVDPFGREAGVVLPKAFQPLLEKIRIGPVRGKLKARIHQGVHQIGRIGDLTGVRDIKDDSGGDTYSDKPAYDLQFHCLTIPLEGHSSCCQAFLATTASSVDAGS